MVTEGIVLGHKIYATGLEVHQAKIVVIKNSHVTYNSEVNKKLPRTCWILQKIH